MSSNSKNISSIIIRKPKRSSKELVEIMKEKGITFNFTSLENAENYILNNNNYLRLCSYRKNFPKYQKGLNKGKYIDLDFEDLKVLANLDLTLRKTILSICMDIEHGIKLNILKECEKNNQDDGYSIVLEFLNDNTYIRDEIIKKTLSGHLKDLLSHYISSDNTDNSLEYTTNKGEKSYLSIPIWILLEVISFRSLILFYEFYFSKINKKLLVEKNILNGVRSIRNACAHNNCLLTNLNLSNTTPSTSIRNFVKNKNISKYTAKKRLSCRVIYEITCVIYSTRKVSSPSIMKNNINSLKMILDDFEENSLYLLKKNDLLNSNYIFLKKVLDK